MARLVNYKAKNENSYISFANDINNVSNEHLCDENSTTNFKLMTKKSYYHPDSSTSLKMCKKRKTHRLICVIFGCILCERMWDKLCCFKKCKCDWCSNCLEHNYNDHNNDLHNCEYTNTELYERKTKYDMNATDECKMNSSVEGISLSLSMTEESRYCYGRRLGDGDGGAGGFDDNGYNYNSGIRYFNANGLSGGGVGGKSNNGSKCNSLKKSNKLMWHWDDSIKSNSDRFLETLEYDEIDDGKRSWRKGLKVPKIRLTAFRSNKGDWVENLLFSLIIDIEMHA